MFYLHKGDYKPRIAGFVLIKQILLLLLVETRRKHADTRPSSSSCIDGAQEDVSTPLPSPNSLRLHIMIYYDIVEYSLIYRNIPKYTT